MALPTLRLRSGKVSRRESYVTMGACVLDRPVPRPALTGDGARLGATRSISRAARVSPHSTSVRVPSMMRSSISRKSNVGWYPINR